MVTFSIIIVVYFSVIIYTQDEVLVMKDVLMIFGLETNEDGSISTNLDVDQFYELYSKFVTPLILDYYSSIIQLMENSR